MKLSYTLIYVTYTALVGCSGAESTDGAAKAGIRAGQSDLLQPTAELPPLPLFAVVPTQPDSARLLWVPWLEEGLRYTVERAPREDGGKWAELDATIGTDSAVVSGLHAGDSLRIAVTTQTGRRLATSVALPFSPVSAPPNTTEGKNIVDGRGEDWVLSDATVHGLRTAPPTGSVLILPMRIGQTQALTRTVLSVQSDGEGTWSAVTEPAPLSVPSGSRVGASFNVSADGIPLAMLTAIDASRVGYCSTSGWGCIELDRTILPANTSTYLMSNGYSGTFNQTWSTQQESLGMAINAQAEGGVIVQAAYALTTSWLGIPNGIELATLQTRPYAQANISATIDTTGGSVPAYERAVFPPISIPIYTAAFLTITAEFGIDTVASLEDRDGDGVSGQWTGSAEISRAYDTGYSSRRARSGSSGFYGPEFVDQTFDVSIQPAFGDGSNARAWFGWRATGSVVLDASVVGELARAELSATTGLVFSHDSTPGAPCGQPVSIAHADIGLGARLDATLDLAFLEPWQFPIADRVIPILGWGRERALASGTSLGRGATAFDFRLLNRDFGSDHDHPGSTPLGFAIDPSRDVTARVGTSGLQSFIDSEALDLSLHPLTTQLGKYTQVVPDSLSQGSHTYAVWMPDSPPETPTPQTLLRAPGQCVSRNLTVQQ